jgi:prepilin-type N-terminal cleavage/methylation domain-containing protein
MNRQERRDPGFTLIEMLVAMSIATIVLGLVSGSLISSMQDNASASTRLANLDQVRQSMDTVSKDLRTAIGPDLLNDACSASTDAAGRPACSSAFVSATPTSVQFYANVGDTDSAGNPAPTLVTYTIAADLNDPTGKTAAITEIRQSVAADPTSSTGYYTWAGRNSVTAPCPTGTVVAGCATRVAGAGIEWPIPATSQNGSVLIYQNSAGATLPTTPAMSASELSQIASVEIALPVGSAANPTAGVSTTVFLPNSVQGN